MFALLVLVASLLLVGCDVHVYHHPGVATVQHQVHCNGMGRCYNFAPRPVIYSYAYPYPQPQPAVAYPPPVVQDVAAPAPSRPQVSPAHYENAARWMWARILPGRTEKDMLQELKGVLQQHGITTQEEREVFYRTYRQLPENTARIPVGVHLWNTANPVEAARMREAPFNAPPAPAPPPKVSPSTPSRPSSPPPRKDEKDEDVLDRIARANFVSLR